MEWYKDVLERFDGEISIDWLLKAGNREVLGGYFERDELIGRVLWCKGQYHKTGNLVAVVVVVVLWQWCCGGGVVIVVVVE